jgi:hypothetical protein
LLYKQERIIFSIGIRYKYVSLCKFTTKNKTSKLIRIRLAVNWLEYKMSFKIKIQKGLIIKWTTNHKSKYPLP